MMKNRGRCPDLWPLCGFTVQHGFLLILRVRLKGIISTTLGIYLLGLTAQVTGFRTRGLLVTLEPTISTNVMVLCSTYG